MIRLLLAASLCIGGALLRADPAPAQAYPNRPIKVVVPFPAGGPTDGMARIISDRLGTVLGQSIVIENNGGGAGGSIGAKFVAAADPDGYTILHHARRIADHRTGRAQEHRLRPGQGVRAGRPTDRDAAGRFRASVRCR